MRTSSLVLLALLMNPATTSAQPLLRSPAEAQRANLHYKLGWELLRSEKWADAVKEFQQAIDIDGRFKLAYYGIGRSYMGLRRFLDAAKAYEICRDLYQVQTAEKFRNSQDADVMRKQEQEEIQVAITGMSVAGPTTNQQTQSNIVRQLRAAQDRLQMKRDQARDMSIQSRVPAFVSLALGSAYFRQERMTDAEREYKAAIDDDPKAGEAHNNLAVLYMFTGRFDESTKEIALAEKSGYRVNPEFKKDLEAKRNGRL